MPVVQDLREHWNAAKPLYDPSRIAVPPLIAMAGTPPRQLTR